MPFEKINARQKLEDKINNDPAFAKAYHSSEKEFSIIKEVVKARKLLGISQGELANKIGLKQQVISRLETKEASPTLRNFIKILEPLGLELTLTPVRDASAELEKQRV